MPDRGSAPASCAKHGKPLLIRVQANRCWRPAYDCRKAVVPGYPILYLSSSCDDSIRRSLAVSLYRKLPTHGITVKLYGLFGDS